MAARGTYSPDGTRIAYTALPEAFGTWKRYRGGRVGKIWILDLATQEIEEIPNPNANDAYPCWLGDTLYFLSDRNHTMNLFAYDTAAKRRKSVRQLTDNADFDVRWVSTGGGLVVYEQAGRIHLFDPEQDLYNEPFLNDSTGLIKGYQRSQGLVFRRGDSRFEGKSIEEFIQQAIDSDECVMVNRNQGSGTRILIDQLLETAQPTGYAVQARNHNAVAAAITQGRADWGMAIENVVDQELLGFLPVRQEQYDFVVNVHRQQRAAVLAFQALLEDPQIRDHLQALGMRMA